MLINDLEANAWGIPSLGENDLVSLNRVKRHAGWKPGCDLGRNRIGRGGSLLGWKEATTSSPAKVDTVTSPRAPNSKLNLLRYLSARFGHVSFERIVSGPGLVNVYRFLRDTGRGEEPPWLTDELVHSDPAATISRNAVEGKSAWQSTR